MSEPQPRPDDPAPATGPSTAQELDLAAPFFIAGHGGMVGSAIWRAAEQAGFCNLIGRRSADLDLRDRGAVDAFFDEQRPSYVVDAAAKVGGIMANDTYPAEFLSDNLRIQLNVMDAAARTGTTRLLFLGSSCIYPKLAAQPIREDSLLTGPLEPTNDAYAIAKIAGVQQVASLRKEYGLRYVSAMPTNLYGPGDNFDEQGSHVLPALIRRIHAAKLAGDAEVVLWGSGTPRREFLHVDDLAKACLLLLREYDEPTPINVGVGEDLTIAELAQLVADVIGYRGRFTQDTSKPDGTPRKLLDVGKIHALGWRAQIGLSEGIAATYDWFLQHSGQLRGA